MNCVIYGEEKMLMEQKLAALKKQYRIHEEDMNVITYWCHETSISEMIEDALDQEEIGEFDQLENSTDRMEEIEECIRQHVPETSDEKFVWEIYDTFKNETGEDGRTVYRQREVKLRL